MTDGPPHPLITKTVTIDAPPSRVWLVLTQPDMIERWMSVEELTIVSEWRVGSPILFRGRLHGSAFENRGTIQLFEPEKIFQYDYWSTLSRSRLADSPENYSVVRFDLTPLVERTLLTLTQSDFADLSIYQHANLYWNGALQILKAICEQRGIKEGQS